ncbi:uncharacterized protein Fot_32926 [Forsythia ovata]|uniref:Uncharacterized protein n=1 Tax=Forsythia ovata TaxID=205694 RepID=A0ABD1T971_9LAMI
MEEHFEEAIKKEWYKEDFKTIASQIKEQENLLRLKRRWLLDLPLSKREQQRIEELMPPNDKILPESLLREDDVCYENIRNFVEKGYSARKCEMEHQVVEEDTSKSYRSAAIKVLDGLEDLPFRTLSAMHRKLRGVRYIPTIQSTKSGWGRDSLISVVRKRCMKMLLELGEGNETPEPLAGALAVAGLTLKLINNTSSVIDFRKFSAETEALQNDIAKAIWLLNDVKRVSLIELKKLQFLLDPSTELSDRSLRMAVRNLLTDYLFECSDMDNVPDCLLETLSIINRRSQLPSRRKCVSSEVHSDPQELMKEIENEVECILTVGAHTKQIVWDLLSEHRLDQDFADAYMEYLEKSEMTMTSDDDSEEELNLPQLYRFHSHYPDDQMESIGETNPAGTNLPTSTSEADNCSPLLSPNERLNVTLESMHINEVESFRKQSKVVNQYLEVQEACDKTGMVAYDLIGCMLDEFSKIEGINLYQGDRSYLRNRASIPQDSEVSRNQMASYKDDVLGSIIVQALDDLVPSFPER